MQSRVTTLNPEHLQRLLTAYRVTPDAHARQDALNAIAGDETLVAAAERALTARLARRYEHDDRMRRHAAEDAHALVLGALHARLDHLCAWRPDVADFPAFLALHAEYHFNNTQRDFCERTLGRRRNAELLPLTPLTFTNEDGEEVERVPLDAAPGPEDAYEQALLRAQARALLTSAGPHAAFLRALVEGDCLDEHAPVSLEGGALRLNWRYGTQKALAARLGVTDRTLRNRVRALEAWLEGLRAQHALAGD